MMIRTKPRHYFAPLIAPLITPLITTVALICPVFTAEAQNVVTDSAITATADPIKLSIDQIKLYVLKTPDFGGAVADEEAKRIARKLDRHVRQFIEGAPFKAFHNTLGISGYETYFNHPDEMFYALSIALPYLTEPTAARTRAFLKAQLKDAPPYLVPGFGNAKGSPRESYTVPDDLRRSGKAKAINTFGVYSFWAYCRFAQDNRALAEHWESIKQRMAPLLKSDYPFDSNKPDADRDPSEVFNGDLAGVIGWVRLARLKGDSSVERQGLARVRQMLQLRINLERTNPRILVKTHAASKALHNMKLARYLDMAPTVGDALAQLTENLGAKRLSSFREARNTWHLAYPPRLIGGENYTSPPHMSRAMFTGAVFIEKLPSDQILRFIDIPWCKGDFYFMEKCAYALWAARGSKWAKLK